MAMDGINPAFLEPKASLRPELLVSAVLHLMSHYAANRGESGTCIKLAAVIERHLKALADLPDLGPVLRATCGQLSAQWMTVVEHTTPPPKKLPLLARFISAAKLQ